MNIPDEAVEAAHAAICEESLEDCMDPDWRGKCVKAVEAAAPILMAQAWNEGCAATTRAVRSGADYPVNPYKVVP